MNYECEVAFEGTYKCKGFGRTEEEAQCNATKNLFSKLIGENLWVDQIKLALKFKKETNRNLSLEDLSVIHVRTQ